MNLVWLATNKFKKLTKHINNRIVEEIISRSLRHSYRNSLSDNIPAIITFLSKIRKTSLKKSLRRSKLLMQEKSFACKESGNSKTC